MPEINLNWLRQTAQQQKNADFSISAKTGDLRIDSRQNSFQRAISWVRQKFTSEATLKMERHGAYNMFLRAMTQHAGFNEADISKVTEKISTAVLENKPLSARHIIQILNEIEENQSHSTEAKPTMPEEKVTMPEAKPAMPEAEKSVPKETHSYADNVAKVQATNLENKPIEDQVEEQIVRPTVYEKRSRYTPSQDQKDFSFEKDREMNIAKARLAETEKLETSKTPQPQLVAQPNKENEATVEKQAQNATITSASPKDASATKASKEDPLAYHDVFEEGVTGEPDKIKSDELHQVLKGLNLPHEVRTEIEKSFKSAESIDKYEFALITNEKLSEWVVDSRSDSWYKEALKETKDASAMKASRRNNLSAPTGLQDRLLSAIQNHDQALSYDNAKFIGKQTAQAYVKEEFHLS